MKRKDFFKSLAAIPFIAKKVMDPYNPEELAAEEAKEKAKSGVRSAEPFKETKLKGRGDFKMFNESCASTSMDFWEQDTEAFFATSSLTLKNPNKHGKIY